MAIYNGHESHCTRLVFLFLNALEEKRRGSVRGKGERKGGAWMLRVGMAMGAGRLRGGAGTDFKIKKIKRGGCGLGYFFSVVRVYMPGSKNTLGCNSFSREKRFPSVSFIQVDKMYAFVKHNTLVRHKRHIYIF